MEIDIYIYIDMFFSHWDPDLGLQAVGRRPGNPQNITPDPEQPQICQQPLLFLDPA